MTNQELIANIRATLEGRLAKITDLADAGYVRGLRSVPAFYAEGSMTLSGLENATMFDQPTFAPGGPIYNRAGEKVDWMHIREAKTFAIRSIQEALAQLDTMFETN